MTTSLTKLLICGFSCLPIVLIGQNDYELFGEPRITISKSFQTNYTMVFSVGGRSQIYNDEFGYDQRQLELTHFSGFKVSPGVSLAGGLMYRNRNWFGNRSDEWRITQQFGTTNTIQKYRLGHRLRSEQRLFEGLTVYRFRYRFAVDFPLNGDRLDRNEAYLIAYSETLLSIANGLSPKGDLRFSIQIGWMLSELLKFQVGVEHRFDNIYLHTEQLSLLFTSLNIDLN